MIRYGIPQGSILGPLLFCIFINDLPLHITSDSVNCEMFADDTSLNASDKNTATVQNELQKSINEVSDWCDKNAMILHPAKTKSMLLATRQKHQLRPLILNLSLKDNHIEQVHEHRYLGIIIDDEFSWRPHITSTCKTILKNLYLLSQLKHFVDTSKQKLFYYAHISPHLTYASTVWDGCSDILFHKLNSLHRRAAKLMMPDLSLTTDAKLQHLGLLPLREKL
ncbi:reverse transcriptase domain-containing protein, partial [Thiolapillus sp.]|uniref:reverse transcriptase domain-containing protein n=1 Tax=Thiolapillus sp. TaxID=2017437 RepID=UPI003AF6F6C3